MAKTAPKVELAASEELEPFDVEVRSPTVVLSVRLDEETAKRLHAVAKRRGTRVSDVLREAAVAFADANDVRKRFEVRWYEKSQKVIVYGTTDVVTIHDAGEPSVRPTPPRPFSWSTALTRD